MITRERLMELLDYDPETGIFVWRVARNSRTRAGSIAGAVATHSTGYQCRRIGIDGRSYLAHRLAWLYLHGRWPVDQIDHIDNDSLNNRIANLREARHAENMRNRGAQANNVSGLKGVSWDKKSRKWYAAIKCNGRMQSIGRFERIEDAASAYEATARRIHGEFANTGRQS